MAADGRSHLGERRSEGRHGKCSLHFVEEVGRYLRCTRFYEEACASACAEDRKAPLQTDQPLEYIRVLTSRSSSLFLIASFFSYFFFPRARTISTLTYRPRRYTRAGISVNPASRCFPMSRFNSRLCKRSLRSRF